MDLITYALCKKLVSDTLAGAGALKGEKGDPGKSAYEIAQEAGYTGTKTEWLSSLKGEDGKTPYIGDNGNWFIGDIDTGTKATGTVKISSENDSSEIIIDEESGTISSVKDGVTTVVANYSTTDSIADADINSLF